MQSALQIPFGVWGTHTQKGWRGSLLPSSPVDEDDTPLFRIAPPVLIGYEYLYLFGEGDWQSNFGPWGHQKESCLKVVKAILDLLSCPVPPPQGMSLIASAVTHKVGCELYLSVYMYIHIYLAMFQLGQCHHPMAEKSIAYFFFNFIMKWKNFFFPVVRW